MEWGRNQQLNGLIQHIFKFIILFLEKFTVIHFFLILDPPTKPAKQKSKKQVAPEKSLRLHTSGSLAAAAEAV